MIIANKFAGKKIKDTYRKSNKLVGVESQKKPGTPPKLTTTYRPSIVSQSLSSRSEQISVYICRYRYMCILIVESCFGACCVNWAPASDSLSCKWASRSLWGK